MKTILSFQAIAPCLLLAAAGILYGAVVRPWRAQNAACYARLAGVERETRNRLESQGQYPTESFIQGLRQAAIHWERGLAKAFPPPPEDRELELDRTYLFGKWGIQPGDPLYKEVERFRAAAAEALGPGREDQAESLARQLAFALLKGGVARVERLTCIPTPWKELPEEGPLRSFEVDLVLTAGIEELMGILEYWVLHSGGRMVVIPDSLTIQKVDPETWTGTASKGMGLPVRLECRSRVVFSEGRVEH